MFGLLSSLLNDISQGTTLRPAPTEKSKSHLDISLPSGWSGPFHGSALLFPNDLPLVVRGADRRRERAETEAGILGCRQIATRLGCPAGFTTGAAAKVRNVDRLGEKVRPGTFGKI